MPFTPRPTVGGSADTWGATINTILDEAESAADDHESRITAVEGWDADDLLPDQAGNSGEFLTTNGSTASWAAVDALPTQSGNAGRVLVTDGSAASWGLRGHPTPQFVAGNRYGVETAIKSAAITGSAAFGIGQVYAAPFYTGPNGCMFTNLNIYVNTGASGNARLGIYSAKATGVPWPDTLLLDAGEVDVTSSGLKTIDITDTLYTGVAPHYIIWLAYHPGVASVAIYRFGNGFQHFVPSIGSDYNFGRNAPYHSQSYGALPATFIVNSHHTDSPGIWTVAG